VLTALQILGAVPLAILPVGLLFALISGRSLVVGLLAYPLICGLLWWGSAVAFRRGRVTLAIILSAVPTLPSLALIGYIVAGLASPLAHVLTGYDPVHEMVAEGYAREVVSTELAYAGLNQGSFGDLNCLKEPQACLGPGYHGPAILAYFRVPPEGPGYRFAFHPGRVTSSPRSFATFAFTAVPLTRGKDRSFCADDRAALCVLPSGVEPRVVDGHCADPCQQEGELIKRSAIADSASVATPEAPSPTAAVPSPSPVPRSARPRPVASTAVATGSASARPSPVDDLAPPPPAPTPHRTLADSIQGTEDVPRRVGGPVSEPRQLRYVEPRLPHNLPKDVPASVVLDCTISRQGKVVDVRILKGHPAVDAAVIDAVRQWIYAPVLLDGVPVVVVTTVTLPLRNRPPHAEPGGEG
jgi:TonB family protein